MCTLPHREESEGGGEERPTKRASLQNRTRKNEDEERQMQKASQDA